MTKEQKDDRNWPASLKEKQIVQIKYKRANESSTIKWDI